MTETGFDFNAFQRQVIEEFRANGGRVGGPFEGTELALLTTIGARTGKLRTTPLAYLTIDGQPAVVASAMGADKNPDWYHNILRNPAVTLETGTETYEAIAAAPAGPARDALFAAVVAADAGFGDYQRRTSRPIPVVTLTRIDTSGVTWTRGLGDFLVEAHDWLRAELGTLRRHADELVAGGDRAPETDLRRHCREFCAALRQHHTGEDRGAFPILAQRFPGLAPVLHRLGEEHREVVRLQAELQVLIDGYEPGQDDAVRLRRDLESLATRLEEHYRYEERTIVGALNSVGPAPEIG
ncbi:nitroreductase/quinone reductase family protein [Actinoplanes auranticolor]|uniref:Hemerythrin n=1 Tax=Actinoplanes auranticolor TaxID=47988 RepID=A0A919SE42_9ACTN|nr:nitroreductase/quinone reductase family protein [Actinoplanes auranticolor]GIM68977.1 hemerythrin [Actinoplanes auranticolor]